MTNKTPCFLIARDRFSCLKNMVEYLLQIPELEVIIIDNQSTFSKLLEWYDTEPCKVYRLEKNYGNFCLFSPPDAIPGFLKPDFKAIYGLEGRQYILSDCDLDLSNIPRESLLPTLQEGLREYPNAVKCGLSLELDDLPDTELAKEARGWELNNWSRKPEDYKRGGGKFISAPVDTTFALYTGVGEQNDFDRCIRTDKPWCARHLSWYYGPHNPPPEDEIHYLKNISKSFNHYSSRLANMLEGKPLNEGLV
jgi:hypothetical protein